MGLIKLITINIYSLKKNSIIYTANDEPHPQVLLALGF